MRCRLVVLLCHCALRLVLFAKDVVCLALGIQCKPLEIELEKWHLFFSFYLGCSKPLARFVLYRSKHASAGFRVMAIQQFAQMNYGVSFDLYQKVKGNRSLRIYNGIGVSCDGNVVAI